MGFADGSAKRCELEVESGKWKVKSGTFGCLHVERLFAQDAVKRGAADAERFGSLNLVAAHFFEDFLCV